VLKVQWFCRKYLVVLLVTGWFAD